MFSTLDEHQWLSHSPGQGTTRLKRPPRGILCLYLTWDFLHQHPKVGKLDLLGHISMLCQELQHLKVLSFAGNLHWGWSPEISAGICAKSFSSIARHSDINSDNSLRYNYRRSFHPKSSNILTTASSNVKEFQYSSSLTVQKYPTLKWQILNQPSAQFEIWGCPGFLNTPKCVFNAIMCCNKSCNIEKPLETYLNCLPAWW